MKKTAVVMATVIALAMSVMAPAVANGRWDSQVTGGGDFGAILVDVSSRTDADGSTKGMFQYAWADGTQAFHGTVDCYYEGANGIAIRGQIKVQEGTRYVDGSTWTVETNHAGNRIRVHQGPSENCGYQGAYSGLSLVSGGFHVR